MKSFIFVFSTFFLIVIFSANLKAQELIAWSKDQKLKWSDYKAEPDTSIFAYALTSYRIEIQPNEVLVDEYNNIKNYNTLTVITYFVPNLSWVYRKDDYLLKHEQLHFDIAELYAQKINLEFEKLKAKKVADYDAYVEVYNRLWTECRAFQKQYDKETNHGLLKEINDKWIEDISLQVN
jgi:hypothetical protein